MFSEFLNWAESNLWKPQYDDGFSERCKTFYIDKTLSRINKYLGDEQDHIREINGIQVNKASDLI